MKLKCTNPNGDIVLARKLNYVDYFFLNVKIAFRNESHSYYFKKMLRLPKKQDCL